MIRQQKTKNTNSIQDIVTTKISKKELEDFIKTEQLAKAKNQLITNRIQSFLTTKFEEVEHTNKNVTDVVMSFTEYRALFPYLRLMFQFEPTTKRADLKRGLFGQLWGANIWVRKDFAGVKVYSKDDFKKSQILVYQGTFKVKPCN